MQLDKTRDQFNSIEKDRAAQRKRMGGTGTDFGFTRGSALTGRRLTSQQGVESRIPVQDLNRTWTALQGERRRDAW